MDRVMFSLPKKTLWKISSWGLWGILLFFSDCVYGSLAPRSTLGLVKHRGSGPSAVRRPLLAPLETTPLSATHFVFESKKKPDASEDYGRAAPAAAGAKPQRWAIEYQINLSVQKKYGRSTLCVKHGLGPGESLSDLGEDLEAIAADQKMETPLVVKVTPLAVTPDGQLDHTDDGKDNIPEVVVKRKCFLKSDEDFKHVLAGVSENVASKVRAETDFIQNHLNDLDMTPHYYGHWIRSLIKGNPITGTKEKYQCYFAVFDYAGKSLAHYSRAIKHGEEWKRGRDFTFIETVEALNKLHMRGIGHGDLNEKNIHLDQGVVKFSGIQSDSLFNLSYRLEHLFDRKLPADLSFTAPEKVLLRVPTELLQSDTFSMGVILLHHYFDFDPRFIDDLYRSLETKGKSNDQLKRDFQEKLNEELDKLRPKPSGPHPSLEQISKAALLELFVRMVRVEAKERPVLLEVLTVLKKFLPMEDTGALPTPSSPLRKKKRMTIGRGAFGEVFSQSHWMRDDSGVIKGTHRVVKRIELPDFDRLYRMETDLRERAKGFREKAKGLREWGGETRSFELMAQAFEVQAEESEIKAEAIKRENFKSLEPILLERGALLQLGGVVGPEFYNMRKKICMPIEADEESPIKRQKACKIFFEIELENAGEDLEKIIVFSPEFLHQSRFHLLLQILDRGRVLHDYGYAHRDIKLANIAVNKRGILRLIDFGSVDRKDKIDASKVEPKGSPLYMSPEILIQQHPDDDDSVSAHDDKKSKPALSPEELFEIYKKADVMAFGYVIGQFYFQVPLESNPNGVWGLTSDIIEREDGNPTFNLHSTRFIKAIEAKIEKDESEKGVPNGEARNMLVLIKSMLQYDYKDRPSMGDALDRAKVTMGFSGDFEIPRPQKVDGRELSLSGIPFTPELMDGEETDEE